MGTVKFNMKDEGVGSQTTSGLVKRVENRPKSDESQFVIGTVVEMFVKELRADTDKTSLGMLRGL